MKIIERERCCCCLLSLLSVGGVVLCCMLAEWGRCCSCICGTEIEEPTLWSIFVSLCPHAQEWVGFIIGGIISALVIPWVYNASLRCYRECLPAQRLWRLSDASSCAIVISCRDCYIQAKQDYFAPGCWATWSEHNRNAPEGSALYQYQNVTGEGQVKALTSLLDSLWKGYGRKIGWRNLYFSSSSPLGTIDLNGSRDIILVGGSPTNRYTRMVLQELPFRVDMSSYPRYIRRRFGKAEKSVDMAEPEKAKDNKTFTPVLGEIDACWIDNKEQRVGIESCAEDASMEVVLPGLRIYQPEIKKTSFYEVEYRYEKSNAASAPGGIGKRYLIRDYAIILRITNRGATSQGKIYIFAGCTTHGTAVAAEFFCTRAASEPRITKMGQRDYLAVVTMKMMPDGRSWRGIDVEAVIPLS